MKLFNVSMFFYIEYCSMQDDVIHNCREKKMSLVKLGEILLGYKRLR